MNSKKLLFFVRLIRNGWIISMQWINFVKVFIYVHMVKSIHFVNIKLKDLRCLKR